MNDDNKGLYDPYANGVDGIITSAIRKYLYRLYTCIPAIVKEVKGRDKVVVSPAVQQVDSNWRSIEWADISLPVCTPRGNGLFVSFPLSVGDTGWIIAGDLDPSLFFKDKSKPQRQNTYERHKYQFGFFVPDAINGYNVSSDDDGCIVVGSKDGKTKVVIGNDTLKIKSDSVIIETTDNASVTIDGVNWKSHTHSKGTLSVPVTSAEGSPSTISGDTGGVN